MFCIELVESILKVYSSTLKITNIETSRSIELFFLHLQFRKNT